MVNGVMRIGGITMTWIELLEIIEEISWEGEGKRYDSSGNDCKIGTIKLQEITELSQTRIKRLLKILKEKKLISKSILFTGSNYGWFATPLGHSVVNVLGDKI